MIQCGGFIPTAGKGKQITCAYGGHTLLADGAAIRALIPNGNESDHTETTFLNPTTMGTLPFASCIIEEIYILPSEGGVPTDTLDRVTVFVDFIVVFDTGTGLGLNMETAFRREVSIPVSGDILHMHCGRTSTVNLQMNFVGGVKVTKC